MSQDHEFALTLDMTQQEIHYLCETERLKSFRATHEWPNDESWFCTPEKLAKAGFFFKPEGDCLDNVCCAFCNKELDGWEPDDDPVVEHKKHSSKCPFLSQRRTVEEMTLEEFIRFIEKIKRFKVEKFFQDAKNSAEEAIKEAEKIMISHVNKK